MIRFDTIKAGDVLYLKTTPLRVVQIEQHGARIVFGDDGPEKWFFYTRGRLEKLRRSPVREKKS